MAKPPEFCPSGQASGLDPIVGATPRVLILGSFPGRKSLLHSEYYGNPQNQFWKIMELLLGIDAGLPYATRVARIAENHIALWDVVRSCSRPGSADSRIRDVVPNGIREFISGHPSICLIALNGSTPARLYGRTFRDIPVPCTILPSTSPANARMCLDEKTAR
jgi:hypoxanthine-DNA glycosylase